MNASSAVLAIYSLMWIAAVVWYVLTQRLKPMAWLVPTVIPVLGITFYLAWEQVRLFG